MRLAFYSISSTWNPCHSRLFTWVWFLTPTLLFFKSRCLAKTTTKLGMVYRVQKQTKHPVFWICGPLRAFCGFLAGCLPGVLVGFLVFCGFGAKVLWTGRSRGGCGVRPACPTTVHYCAASRNATYMRGRGEEYVETFKMLQFPWFLGVSVLDDDPSKS